MVVEDIYTSMLECSVDYLYLTCGRLASQAESLPAVTSPVRSAWLPNTSQSLKTITMANISPRAKLKYDSDTFSLDFNVDEYSPEVGILQHYRA